MAQNSYFKTHLQPIIMLSLLGLSVVKPNRHRIIEGRTLLERAQKTLDMLRRKEVSAERLVWSIPDKGPALKARYENAETG